MKQLFIGQNKPYATSANGFDLTTVPEGAIVLFNLDDGKPLTAVPTKNFGLALGRGENKMPLMFPEIDVKTLTATKAEYKAGVKFTATITVPTPEKGTDYTVVVTKKGTVFNERNNWSFNGYAKDTIAANVAKQIAAQITANKYQLGVEATYEGGKIVITALEEGKDFEVLGADGLIGVEPTDVKHGEKAICDKAYIQDLASRCAAGKGFNYVADEGKEIYPGYPEAVDADKYVLYTLRFAVPRVAAKQRDEVVYQIVHIALPSDAAAISTLDTVLELTTATEGDGK